MDKDEVSVKKKELMNVHILHCIRDLEITDIC